MPSESLRLKESHPTPSRKKSSDDGGSGGIIVFFVFIFLIVFPTATFAFFMKTIYNQPQSATGGSFIVETGEGGVVIATHLYEQKFVSNATVFKVYLWVSGLGEKLQAGLYQLPVRASMVDIAHILSSGKVQKNEVRVTIPEGSSSVRIADILASDGVMQKEDFLQLATVSDTRTLLPDAYYNFFQDKPADQGLEGYFFPDTYFFYRDSESSLILKKFLDTFQKRAGDLLASAQANGKNIHEVLTLASIVEAEAQRKEDKRLVAGIFLKRLEIGMPLQSDATVNFVTGKSALQPTSEDLAQDSLYNTYQHVGLPPGPINNPGLESIEAVLQPELSDYLYFIALPDVGVIYAKTFEEHKQNKEKYL